MMTAQILKSVDFTKTQKSRYLENETFFLQMKNLIIQGYFMAKNTSVVEVTNLENVLQGNVRAERTRECILRVSGGTNFENFFACHQLWSGYITAII